jgi:hypothetical protein
MLLKDIVSAKAGYPFRGAITALPNAAVRVVQMKDTFVDQAIEWSACITTELPSQRSADFLLENDILFTARGTKNYAVLVDAAVAHYQAVAAPHFYVLRLTTPRVLPAFLAWWLNQYPSQQYFQREAEGSVTKSIRRSVLENVPITMPSLSKQHAIIGLANTLKQERQLSEQLLRNGERLMNTIANDLFNDKEVAP